jgi:predicted ATP-grasp superfamily ATP-dependent carboligase
LPCQVTPIASAADEQHSFTHLAAAADWTLLIAPESGGALAQRCGMVAEAGGRLLSPSPQVVKIASDKQATAELLATRGVPAAAGVLLSAGGLRIPPALRFPAVIKPVDGCGSQDVRLIRTGGELPQQINRPLWCEEFVPGLAASVAVLCGPAQNHALPACEQRLSSDGQFTYLGGRLPLHSQLDLRARRLALAAIAALPQPHGYIGVDLVLGDAADGSGDRAIEINPRLTTSYAGLRAAANTNLAAAMLAVAEGRTPDLCFHARPVEFAADGSISLARQASCLSHVI